MADQILQNSREQLLMEELFDPASLSQTKAAINADEFPVIDDRSMITDYCCPFCSYEWSGNPKPGALKDAVIDVESTDD
jgi:hypothetical protein